MFAILGFIFNAIVACVVFFLIIAVWQIAKRLYNRSSLRRAKVARSSTYPLYRQTNYRIPYSSGTSRDTSSLASNNVTVSVSAKDDSFDDSFLDDDPTLPVVITITTAMMMATINFIEFGLPSC